MIIFYNSFSIVQLPIQLSRDVIQMAHFWNWNPHANVSNREKISKVIMNFTKAQIQLKINFSYGLIRVIIDQLIEILNFKVSEYQRFPLRPRNLCEATCLRNKNNKNVNNNNNNNTTTTTNNNNNNDVRSFWPRK